jgi:superfamily II DNA/RNA helicase
VGVRGAAQLDFAPNAVTHLHRVGRTARAGAAGTVTNIVGPRSRDVAAAVQGEAGAGRPLAPVFSRNRGFRRRIKRNGTGLADLAPAAAAGASAPAE